MAQVVTLKFLVTTVKILGTKKSSAPLKSASWQPMGIFEKMQIAEK